MQQRQQLVTEMRDSIEIVHTSEYGNFLKYLFPAFHKLLVDGKPPQWSRPGRELLADFLESKPQLAGVPLGWRVEAQTASLVVEAEDKAEVAASWPLSQLIAEEGAAGCKDVRRPGRWQRVEAAKAA